jgi:hypothetical protein
MFRDKVAISSVRGEKEAREAVPDLDGCSSILMDKRVDILRVFI